MINLVARAGFNDPLANPYLLSSVCILKKTRVHFIPFILPVVS